MSNNTTFKQRLAPGLLFAMLSMVAGIASCGGGNGGTTRAAPVNSTPVSTTLFATATPSLIPDSSPAQTAVITWSSTESTSCTSTPSGIAGTSGTFTTPSLSATTTYTITCDGPTGQKSKRVTIARAPAAVVTAITDQQTACANEAVRGTSYYYCDCGRGAASNCVAGDDTNDGTDPATPRRTIANAMTKLATLTGTNSLRFCKGGAFDAATNLSVPNTNCALGTTCTDFREYTSSLFSSSAKPILNSAPGGATLFTVAGGRGGARFLNLRLHGSGIAGNDGIFLYSGAHDVTACNLDIDGFSMGVDQNPGSSVSVPANTNILITGNNFTNNVRMGYWGGGPAAEISKNRMTDNGGGNTLDHTMYLSSQHFEAQNMKISENYMHGQIGDTCYGVMIVGHGKLTGLQIQNNVLAIDESADAPQCYGIALDSGGYLSQINFSNAIISGNTLSNTGYVGIAASNCADCLIEKNVIAFNTTATLYGISAGNYISRPLYSDIVNDRNAIKNNTIWFGPNVSHGAIGIQIRNEGTGHIVANNSVNYTSASAGNGVSCFDFTQPLASYTFINNNHCNSAAPYNWDKTNGTTIAAWRAYSTAGGHAFDGLSIIDPPQFVNTSTFPYDFHTDPASPLQTNGSTAHMPTSDITGAPFTDPPDIGAYE